MLNMDLIASQIVSDTSIGVVTLGRKLECTRLVILLFEQLGRKVVGIRPPAVRGDLAGKPVPGVLLGDSHPEVALGSAEAVILPCDAE